MTKTLVSALLNANAALAQLVSALAAELGGIADTATVTTTEPVKTGPTFNPTPPEIELPSEPAAKDEPKKTPERFRRTKEEIAAGLTSEEAEDCRARGIAPQDYRKQDVATSEPEPEPEKPATTTTKKGGKTADEWYSVLAEVVAKLVKEGRASEVKPVVAKYANGGRMKDYAALLEKDASSFDAFKAEIAAM